MIDFLNFLSFKPLFKTKHLLECEIFFDYKDHNIFYSNIYYVILYNKFGH